MLTSRRDNLNSITAPESRLEESAAPPDGRRQVNRGRQPWTSAGFAPGRLGSCACGAFVGRRGDVPGLDEYVGDTAQEGAEGVVVLSRHVARPYPATIPLIISLCRGQRLGTQGL